MKLTKKDYIDILKFYNINYTSTTSLSLIKKLAENIIATKLCSCIKHVNKFKNDETRSISICKNSVVTKKGLHINKFTCKKKKKLIPNKKTKISISKI